MCGLSSKMTRGMNKEALRGMALGQTLGVCSPALTLTDT